MSIENIYIYIYIYAHICRQHMHTSIDTHLPYEFHVSVLNEIFFEVVVNSIDDHRIKPLGVELCIRPKHPRHTDRQTSIHSPEKMHTYGVHVCMCVCMYVRTWVGGCISNVCMYVCICVCMCVCMHVYMYAYICVCKWSTHTNKHTYEHTHTHTHTYIYI